MKKSVRLLAAAALVIVPAMAFAASDPHHPGGDAAAAAEPGPMSGGQAGDMMQMMQMMQQMMGMMQGATGMTPGTMQNMPMAGMSDASKAYMGAMSMMGQPMMQAALSSDPDVAFVKGMIPHHQGAIAMAKAVLQYGKDDKVKEWANQIIKSQEAEVAEMQDWLKSHAQ